MPARKAVVVESEPGWAILLLPGGKYSKIKTDRNLRVGQEYRLPRTTPLGYGAAAAIFMLVLFGVIDFFSVKAYARLEPGIELGINRWDRVVSVDTGNKAGSQAVKGLRLAGKPVETAVGMLVDKTMENGEPGGQKQNMVSIEVNAKDKNQPQLEKRLLSRINKEITRRINQQSFAERKAQFEIKRDNKRLLLKLKNNGFNRENIQIDASRQKGPVKPLEPVKPDMSWPNQGKEEGTVNEPLIPSQTVLSKPVGIDKHEKIKEDFAQRWQERQEIIQENREEVQRKWEQKKEESQNKQTENSAKQTDADTNKTGANVAKPVSPGKPDMARTGQPENQ